MKPTTSPQSRVSPSRGRRMPPPLASNPHRFHEDRSEIAQDLVELTRRPLRPALPTECPGPSRLRWVAVLSWRCHGGPELGAAEGFTRVFAVIVTVAANLIRYRSSFSSRVGTAADVISLFMALLSFVESAPRA